jgi:hypothetical protein
MKRTTSIDLLAKKARNSISKYCIEECKAYCCRKGYLELKDKEMILTIGDKRQELEETGFLCEIEGGSFILNMSSPGGCPSLDKNFMCKIHKEKNRTLACKNFPIFVNETAKTIRISPRCAAFKSGKFYAFTREIKLKGYRLE